MSSPLYPLPRDVKIGLFGHYGRKNLGDEATIQAVIQNIKLRIPEASITGFSIKPEDTIIRHNINAFPITKAGIVNSNASNSNRQPVNQTQYPGKEELDNKVTKLDHNKLKNAIKRIPILYGFLKGFKDGMKSLFNLISDFKFIPRFYRSLKGVDLLLVTGSNQIVDNFGGPWDFPYNLFKWSILSKFAGTKVYYISVGAGPINSSLSCFFLRWALRFADYISLRDNPSKQLIENIGFRGKSYVYPDLAHSLDINCFNSVSNELPVNKSGLPIIGINPLPMYNSEYWWISDDGRYADYLRRLTDACSKLILEGYPVLFFATQPRDNAVIDDVLNALKPELARRVIGFQEEISGHTVDNLMEKISHADIIIATRFHGTVLSFVAEKPVIALYYYRKARDLMMEMGQDQYSLDIDSFTSEELWNCLKKLEKNYHDEVKKIKEKNKALRVSLDEQYDRLFINGIS
jgi:polysaccharide pyruvyl transferase WcaK-like protein